MSEQTLYTLLEETEKSLDGALSVAREIEADARGPIPGATATSNGPSNGFRNLAIRVLGKAVDLGNTVRAIKRGIGGPERAQTACVNRVKVGEPSEEEK